MFKTILACGAILMSVYQAAAEPLRIYLDADRSTNLASARSIEIGIRSAFEESEGRFGGRDVEFVVLDHRANARRTQRHLDRFLDDENAIAMIGGLHSPPYLNAKDFVNQNGIPLLLPWSAAAPLTRTSDGPNSIFRLSLDDSIAAEVIVPFALEQSKCKKIKLLLWDSGWGRSNERTMTAALQARSFDNFSVSYFASGLSDVDAISLAGQIELEGADCAILVGNAPEGKAILQAINSVGLPVKLLSHWGITGGSFEQTVSADERDSVGLTFIQPCFDFKGRNSAAKSILDRIISANPDAFDDSGYLRAPAGLFHGYDLGRILVAALSQIDFSHPIADLRTDLIAALEAVEGPIAGLLRDYDKPFSAATPGQSDAHEALRVADFCMARFDANDRITPFLN